MLSWLFGNKKLSERTPLMTKSNRLLSSDPSEAVQLYLSGDFAETEKLISKDESILTQPIAEAEDRFGRKFVNTTLFRIMAATGAFERFAAHLSPEKIKEQLRLQFPPGSEQELAKRMQLYSAAIIAFGKVIINIQIPENSNGKNECKPAADNLKKSLQKITSQEVISTGFLFNLELILCEARKYVENNKTRFKEKNAKWFWRYGIPLGFTAPYDLQMILGDNPFTIQDLENLIKSSALANLMSSRTAAIEKCLKQADHSIDKEMKAPSPTR